MSAAEVPRVRVGQVWRDRDRRERDRRTVVVIEAPSDELANDFVVIADAHTGRRSRIRSRRFPSAFTLEEDGNA